MNNYIHSFKLKNFFSFKEEAVFSFVVDKKAPDSKAYVVADSGERISKVGMVVGPNAAGKTNLFRALDIIKKMISTDISDTINRGKRSPSLFSPFSFFVPFSGNETEETMLSVDFNIGERVYEYVVFLDTINKVVSREFFSVKDMTKQRKTKKEIFSRVYDQSTKKTSIKFDKDRMSMPDDIEGALSAFSQFGVISVLRSVDQNNVFGKEIYSFWDIVLTNVGDVEDLLIGKQENNSIFNSTDVYSLLSSVCQHSYSEDIYEKHPVIKKEMEELLSRFDTGIESVTIEKKEALNDKKEKASKQVNITTKHTIDGKSVDMDFRYDSAGTRQMYLILSSLLKTKRDGGLVAIDEIDINLHPLILLEIMNLFLGEVVNKENAQFIFSTHAHSVMRTADKHQVYIVEKDEDGRSDIYRLDSLRGVRVDESYFSNYLAGKYGGIPHIH